MAAVLLPVSRRFRPFMRRSLVLITAASLLLLAGSSRAGDLRITLPKRTKPTPVQALNRDGVKAVEKHNYKLAKKLFYKAYLLDPNDPFTLNNLGYMAELEGDVERAQRFYSLSAEQTSDATVDVASTKSVKGKPVTQIAGNAADTGMMVNQLNIKAIMLLNKDRAPEADLVLEKALAMDPRNPFTLNNLGYAKEKEGEYEKAMSFYTQAANLHSEEPVLVTVHQSWRGKGISEVAHKNAEKTRKLIESAEDHDTLVARLNLRGVSALNRNDRRAAREYFTQAYKLAPEDAFTLNNMGYVSELDGDRETADFYYDKARQADRHNHKVEVSNVKDAEGRKLDEVAGISDEKVNEKIDAQREMRARMGGPVQLKRRDNTPVPEPANPPAPQKTSPQPQSAPTQPQAPGVEEHPELLLPPQ